METPRCKTCGAEMERSKDRTLWICKKCGETTPFWRAGRWLDLTIDPDEDARRAEVYDACVDEMNAASTESEYKAAAASFKRISGFRDADALSERCFEQSKICRKDAVYETARSMMTGSAVSSYEAAIQKFNTIPGWKDADEQILACQKRIEEIKAEESAYWQEKARKAKRAAKNRKRALMILAPILVACLAFVIVLFTVILPNRKYQAAEELLRAGKYDEAAEAFLALNGFRDSEQQVENCYIAKFGTDWYEYLKALRIGDTYTFGAYEQDNDTANGKEPIEWIILEKKDLSALVISKYALDCQPFNEAIGQKEENLYRDFCWANCTIREWLNADFMNEAFNAEQKSYILTSEVSADMNPEFSTSPGSRTTDRIFLLSTVEAIKYFDSKEARTCTPTAYAIARGGLDGYLAGDEATFWWWLRTPGYFPSGASYVNYIGDIGNYGFYGYYTDGAVRPAMWIKLGADKDTQIPEN